jgi:hypothetical protein
MEAMAAAARALTRRVARGVVGHAGRCGGWDKHYVTVRDLIRSASLDHFSLGVINNAVVTDAIKECARIM